MSNSESATQKTAPDEALTEQQLEEISGGLNPQPLPPSPPPDLRRF
jgi:hypothetical protein